MKPPLKPFTVEVKRSRSHTLPAKPVVNEPSVFIEAGPARASVSQARQMAEKMFTSLTISSDVEPKARVSAESVFRPVGALAAPVERLAEELLPGHTGSRAPTVEETIPAKPRRQRAVETRTASAPVGTGMKPNVAIGGTVPMPVAPKRPQSGLGSKLAKASSPSEKIDQAVRPSAAAEATRQDRQNWEWARGERWKKRLRHLR